MHVLGIPGPSPNTRRARFYIETDHALRVMATDNKPLKPDSAQESDLHTEIKQRLPRWCAVLLEIESRQNRDPENHKQ